MITILSDDTSQMVGEQLYRNLCEKNVEAEYIAIGNLNVGPCYSCGGCTDKTYGKCIHRDDCDVIFPKLIHSDVMVIVTPVVWGSYSFKTKRVFDKCAVIGDRHYYVKNGELVKGKLGHIHGFYAIGVKNDCREEEQIIFKNLVAENIKIMNIKGNAYVVDQDVSGDYIDRIVEEMSR